MALTRATGKIIGDSNGNLNLSGIVTASSFVGSGSALTGVASTDHIKTSTVANFTGGIQVGSATTLTGALSATTATATSVVVGSAVTVNSQGLDVTGVITATSFKGSGANLTSLPAANLTGTLPAISGANLTGINTAFGNSSVNTSAIITATAFIPSQGQLSHRNIIINGAMQVAQRSTSATSSSSGYYAVDRLRVSLAGLDEGITIAQSTLTSSDTPYTKGFRYATKITNGNQTSGAGSGDTVALMYRFEGQDINSSGWEYTNSSSFITISFWIKSSVAQTFYLRFRMTGSSVTKEYVFAVNATTSWQKITQAIPGATGVDAVNTTAEGGFLFLVLFHGTDQTGSITINQWNTSSSTRVPNMTSTWYTTNDATIEITGLQMEVGSVATPFESRTFAEELHRCRRYCQIYKTDSGGGTYTRFASGIMQTTSSIRCIFYLNPEMRVIPSATKSGNFQIFPASGLNISNLNLESGTSSFRSAILLQSSGMSGTAGSSHYFSANDDATAQVTFDSEL